MGRAISPRRSLWALGTVLVLFVLLVLRREQLMAAGGPRPQYFLKAKPARAAIARPSPPGASPDTIQNSTLGFERIFVVSLPTRTDRRDAFALQAAVTDIHFEFVDGVRGSDMAENAIPKTEAGQHIADAELGCWRSHMNVMQEIVRRNISTALIMEDDSDWDVRIKAQLRDFAAATRALTQPLAADPGAYADPTFRRRPADPAHLPDMAFERLPPTAPPQVSPYGDDWDLLWIGHCAQTFPADDKPAVARGRVIQANDSTVPARHHLESPFIQPFMLADEYPDHTRAVHHSRWGACTSAYAVSQRGARKIVLQLGLKEAVAPVDLLLRAFCDSDAGRGENQCLTTQPSLVNHHRPVGPIAEDSDIRDAGTGFRHVGETKMIRLSARLNAEALIWGGTDLKDRYPDAVDGAKLP